MTRKNKKEDLTEISLITPSQNPVTSGILRGLLIKLGVRAGQVIESSDRFNVKASTYLRSAKKAADLKKKFRQLKLKGVAIRLKILKPKDWKHKWKVDFRPFQLTERIDVVPMAQKKTFKPGRRIPIYIETTNAFGSGLHETTRFMAQLIESCRGGFDHYLDIGTGTGILSLVALKNGAKDVCGVDIDRRCTATAKENLKENGYCYESVGRMDILRYPVTKKFDFVGANLITHELIRVKRKLISLIKPGQYLAVSGIMQENLSILRAAFKGLPLRCCKIMTGKQWVALLFRKVGAG